MSTVMTPAESARRELSGSGATVIGPADVAYEDARKVYNAMIARNPAAIIRCTSAGDVARAIGFARHHELPLAVRGGGHNGAGLGTCDDGVVIDLSPLDDIVIDAPNRTVRVGGGCTWGQVDRATGEYGLATPSGIISTTGVGGLTLGGGLGHLTRRYGLTIDNLLSADVVLADGGIVRARPNENPDLFWALRGGGGNFGVVTQFEFRLHDVGTVVAGPTLWPVEQGAEVLAAFADFMPTAPRELNGFFAFLSVPPGPPFPEPLHLRKACGIVWCYSGDEADAAGAMAPLLDVLPEPLLHGPGPMPHATLQGAFDGVYPPGQQWYWRADFVNEVPPAALDAHQQYGAAMPTWQSSMHLYPIDGAVHDVGPADTAFSYRDAKFASVIVGVDPDPANAGLIRDWTVDYFDALHPYSAGGAYVNMMMDEGQERVRASYRGNYDRLAAVKAAYDPDNAFRINQNIHPAG
jgi:FAD/FMN-containing dehydrogenase